MNIYELKVRRDQRIEYLYMIGVDEDHARRNGNSFYCNDGAIIGVKLLDKVKE